MSNEYDIAKAFQKIEETLIKSMKRNLTRHLNEENDLDFNWVAWQTEQLKSLEKFKKENRTLFRNDFDSINNDITEFIKKWNDDAKLKQEKEILETIKNGNFKSSNKEIDKLWGIYNRTKNHRIKKKQLTRIYKEVNKIDESFFKINQKKLTALINETTRNMQKAEMSILRYANDQYKQIIYNAQVFANTGAGTVRQAIDMATKDFLSKGINSIEYGNCAIVNIASYAEMAIRTANKRAYLQGEGAKRNDWGVHTVLVPNRGGGCPYCIKFQGKIFIDDVWSGGTAEESKATGYPLLSEAIKQKLFHPNCKDTIVTYYPGITEKPIPPTKEELAEKERKYKIEQKQRYNERQIRKYKRLELGSIDNENIEKYHNKRVEWQKYNKEYCEKYNLKRQYDREKIYNIEKNKKDDIIEIPSLIKDITQEQNQIFSQKIEDFVNKNTVESDFIFDENFSKPMAYNIDKDKIIINPKHANLKYYNIDESIAHETVHLKDIRNNIIENNKEMLKDYMGKVKNYFKSDMAYYGRIVADNEYNSSLCDLVNIFTNGRIKNGAFAHEDGYVQDEINCLREISATLISCELSDNKVVNMLVEDIKPLKEMKEEILKLWDVLK